MVVELLMQRLKGGLEVGKIKQPARCWVDLSLADQLDSEAVPVHPGALVARRDVREPVRGFEREFADKADIGRS